MSGQGQYDPKHFFVENNFEANYSLKFYSMSNKVQISFSDFQCLIKFKIFLQKNFNFLNQNLIEGGIH